MTVADFDENKSGYRKLRVKKQKQQAVQTIKIDHAVVTSENIPLKVLSEKLGITAVEITKRLFKEGIAKTINDSIDYDTAAYIAADLGIELEYQPEKTAEEVLADIYKSETVDDSEAAVRPPVVTVMGHVDHGKTSLLDKIRSANVTAGEAGGITQHIGAYSVTVGGKTITFLDTPGHEAFTAMRARGASVTDIVVLVVAADDGIMPQTVEAINHAKAAEVPIIVAVNKMDKPEANLDRVKQGLTNNGLVPEEWGGDTIICPVSAKTGEGIDNLLESINLVAEVRELKANPNQMARGTIIEAKLDKGKGPVASVLIQNGTLHTGDNVISGTTSGRVRAMVDDKGRTVKSAGPSMAVSILGLEEVPNAGDSIIAVEQDKLLKQVLEERKRKESEAMIKVQTRVTLDDVFGKIAEGQIKGLNIIVKGDVQGSVEAVKQSLLKLSNDEVRVNVLHSGGGRDQRVGHHARRLRKRDRRRLQRPPGHQGQGARRAQRRRRAHLPHHLRAARRHPGGDEGHARAQVPRGHDGQVRRPADVQDHGRRHGRRLLRHRRQDRAQRQAAHLPRRHHDRRGRRPPAQALQRRRQGGLRRL